VYIVGDLNVRLDRDDDINTKQLLELLDVYWFTVQVSDPTHARGGLLDVVATRRDDAPLPVTVYDAGLSDHHLLLWSVPISRPPAPVVSVVHRPWHQLSIDELQGALAESRLCQRDHWANFNADQLAELYDSEITSVLDRLIPAKTVTIRQRPSDP